MKAGKAHLALAALALIAGCSPDAGNDGAGADNALPGAVGGNEAGSDDSAAARNAGEGAAQQTAEPTLLVVADGIIVGGRPDARIPFGTNSRDTIARVTPLLGATYDRSDGAECGAGPMEFADWGKVVLNFQDGEFVGWELRDGSAGPSPRTPGGAAIGMPRAQLEAALGAPLAVERSSLGIEFTAGGFNGLLSSEAADGTVTALWAGTNCSMR